MHPGILRITEPWFAEHANLYVVRGNAGTLLVDTGTGIENLPVWLAAQHIHPTHVVMTHAHFDHCGGLHDFAPEEILLTAEQAKALYRKEEWGLQYFLASDVHMFQRDAVVSYTPVAPNAFQHLENAINLGNYQFQVLRVGGHTDDSFMLHEPNHGWLFTGDVLYDGALYTDFPTTDIIRWNAAFDCIASLSLSAVFPGHNRILQEPDIKRLLDVKRF